MTYILIVTFFLNSGPAKMTYRVDSPDEAAVRLWELGATRRQHETGPIADLYGCEANTCQRTPIPPLILK